MAARGHGGRDRLTGGEHRAGRRCMTPNSDSDAGAGLQPQGGTYGPSLGEPNGDPAPVTGGHGNAPAAAADPRALVTDL
ncbi:hypothetical protein DKP78_22985, partial [Enterococcus faecium]